MGGRKQQRGKPPRIGLIFDHPQDQICPLLSKLPCCSMQQCIGLASTDWRSAIGVSNGMLKKQKRRLRLIGMQIGGCQGQPAIGVCLAVMADCYG